jgi:hypothetical protein
VLKIVKKFLGTTQNGGNENRRFFFDRRFFWAHTVEHFYKNYVGYVVIDTADHQKSQFHNRISLQIRSQNIRKTR